MAGASIAWQALTVAVIGLVIGIPLGIALGRVAWAWVADHTPLLYVAPFVPLVVAVLTPCVLLVALVLAAMPARSATHLRAATVLRSE